MVTNHQKLKVMQFRILLIKHIKTNEIGRKKQLQKLR